MICPKFNLLYYKNVLNRCVLSFFEDRNEFFAKDGSGKYVYSANSDVQSFTKYFEREFMRQMSALIRPWSVLNPEYFVVIGGCEPRQNMLMEFQNGYFPEKLRKLVWADSRLKYVLAENDIVIDIGTFNTAAEKIFENAFASEKPLFGKGFENVIFIKHRNLDCYSMFKTLKYICGKNACVNVYAEKMTGDRQCIVAVNDLICRYVNNKTQMNASPGYKIAVREVKQFLEQKLN